jgi:hypothetical protein
MSRTNRALMIPDSNQECFMKMSVVDFRKKFLGGGLVGGNDLEDVLKYFKLSCEVQRCL